VEGQNNAVNDAKRRKRIQAYKKGIITFVIIMLILPNILSVTLFIKVINLQKQVDDIKEYITDIKDEEPAKPEDGNGQTTEPDESGEEETSKQDEETTTESSNGEDSDNVSSSTTITPYKEWTAEQQAIIDRYTGVGEGRTIYLTFDDGPSVYTEEILQILDYYQVKATFFVVGKEDANSLSRYKAIAEAGHTIGLHSYSHRYAEIYASLDNFVADLYKIHDLIYECTNQKIFLYRFPGGTSTTKTLLPINTFLTYLKDNGFRYFDWNATCGDGLSATVPMEQIVTNVMDGATKYTTCVALLHDAKSKRTTVDGLPLLIETLINAGYEIRAIDENTKPIQHRILR